jgi:hypothetical protein
MQLPDHSATLDSRLLAMPKRPTEKQVSTMDELIARLESLFGRYAATLDQGRGDDRQAWEQFRKELGWLIAEYGPKAIDAALDEMPDGAGVSHSLH